RSDAAVVRGEAGFGTRGGYGCKRNRGDEKGAIHLRALLCPAAAAISCLEPAQFRLHGCNEPGTFSATIERAEAFIRATKESVRRIRPVCFAWARGCTRSGVPRSP